LIEKGVGGVRFQKVIVAKHSPFARSTFSQRGGQIVSELFFEQSALVFGFLPSRRSAHVWALGGGRCDMPKDRQNLFEFIALVSTLRPVFEHHDDAARRFSRGWIDFWSVAENVIGIEI